jgi:NAD kinase
MLSKLKGQHLRSMRTQEMSLPSWKELKFALFEDGSDDRVVGEMANERVVIRAPHGPSSEQLRAMLFRSEAIEPYVPSAVAEYVGRHRLFLPGTTGSAVHFCVTSPRLMIVYDERNANSVAVAEQYRRYESSSPNLILVIGGDGTMLRAIREHWKRRLPFVGFNAGHLGFLMNAKLPAELDQLPLISQSLPLLRVDARFPNGEQTTNLAYGDTWVERAEGQAAWLRVDLNGETQLEKVVGDGMLVATASGSSAYARAMGAVPVPIDSPSLTLAGSNIFQPRFWKPMVLPATSRITLTSLDTIGKRPIRGFVDGLPLGLVQEIAVRQSLTASVELAFTKEFEPSSKLLKSLFPSEGT